MKGDFWTNEYSQVFLLRQLSNDVSPKKKVLLHQQTDKFVWSFIRVIVFAWLSAGEKFPKKISANPYLQYILLLLLFNVLIVMIDINYSRLFSFISSFCSNIIVNKNNLCYTTKSRWQRQAKIFFLTKFNCDSKNKSRQ